MFELRDKETGEVIMVYGTRTLDGKIQFLVYYKEFRWHDSGYYEPK